MMSSSYTYRNVVETSDTDSLPAELPAAVLQIPVELLVGADAALMLDVPRIFAAGPRFRLRQRTAHRTCRS